MEAQVTEVLCGTTGLAVAPIIGASFAAITGKLPPAHWLTTRTQTMTRSADYMRGRNSKLAGLAYDASRALDWRMGWLETHPELNTAPEVPEDWASQLEAYRHGGQGSANDEGRGAAGDVTLNLGLTPAQAEALAHFVNRVGTREVRTTAVDDGEAGLMRDAIIALADALAAAGYTRS